MTLKEICKPVEEHLESFHDYYKATMKSNVSLLNLIVRYMTRKKGKQIRPLLVLLSASICGEVSQRSFVGAAMVELLHNATLIHDDVVDESSTRRGIASINAAWNNKISVLIGDYLLSRGLLTAIDKGEFDFLRATSSAVRRMSEGELLQIQKSKEASLDEDTYFRIIADKTASLLASCCEIGALSATTDVEKHQKLREYGENIGIAFQIRDDIFDYTGNSNAIGKPVGNDLKEKKLTLPLIYSCRQVEKSEGKKIVSLVKNGKLKTKDIQKITEFVIDNGGIGYSERKAGEFIAKAIATLEGFPDSEAKNSLINFSNFVLKRDK